MSSSNQISHDERVAKIINILWVAMVIGCLILMIVMGEKHKLYVRYLVHQHIKQYRCVPYKTVNNVPDLYQCAYGTISEVGIYEKVHQEVQVFDKKEEEEK